MAEDPQPPRLADIDPWVVVEEARRERAPLVAEGCRSAVAWLYRGNLPSAFGGEAGDAPPEPPRRARIGWLGRSSQWLRDAGLPKAASGLLELLRDARGG